MLPPSASRSACTRRQFALGGVLGAAALASFGDSPAEGGEAPVRVGGLAGVPHFAARAKRVIYLFQSGGPSHLELFDHKPGLAERQGSELPDSVRMGQRLTGMTSGQKSFPVLAPKFKFAQHGQAGTWISELLPHTAEQADRLCVVRSLWTESINHDPAITFLQTGSQQPGRPSLGAWASFGLGTDAAELPAFVVLLSQGSGRDANQGLLERLWGAGFLPASHQGVKLRGGADPVLYLSNPPGIDRGLRRELLGAANGLNRLQQAAAGDPEIAARTAQFELAFRMQASVPELVDFSSETAATLALYGPDAAKPGTFAAHCLLARRLVERGVRFVQLYHRGWDHHNGLPENLPKQCRDVDQPQAALLRDLAQRGLLDETLVVWGGEFGRTVYGQGGVQPNYGRDHHGRCFTVWLAGGGIRGGQTFGATDDYGYNVVERPVHIHDLHATILHLLGIDHQRLTFRYQGRDFRLTDVHGQVVKEWLA